MLKHTLALATTIASVACFGNTKGEAAANQASKTDSTIYITLCSKNPRVFVYKEGKDESYPINSFSFGGKEHHFFLVDGGSTYVKDTVLKGRQNLTVEWISALTVDEYKRFFDSSRPLYIVDLCDTTNGYVKRYAVATNDYQDVDDLIVPNVWHESPMVNGNEPLLVNGSKGLLVGKNTPYPFSHKIRGKRFTPMFDDVCRYQLNLIYKNHPDTLLPYKPLFFGAIENGKKMLYVVYLSPSQKLYYSWNKKTERSYSDSRNAFVYEYSIANDSITNTEFIYKSDYVNEGHHTYAYKRGSLLSNKTFNHDTPFKLDNLARFKKGLAAGIKSLLPQKIEYLQKKRVTLYIIMLVDEKGKIDDAAIGWYDFKSTFWERDLSKIRSYVMQQTLKIETRKKDGKKSYYQPLYVAFSPDDWSDEPIK